MLNSFIDRAWPRVLASVATVAASVVTISCSRDVPPADGLPEVLTAGVAPSGLPGIGTEQAQARILDKLGDSTSLALHWVRDQPDSAVHGDTLLVEDLSSGETLVIDARPIFTHRDIDSLSIQHENDSTAFIHLTIKGRAGAPLVAGVAARPNRRTALLVNNRVLTVETVKLHTDSTFFAIGLNPARAESLASHLRVPRKVWRK
jgi:hypothetical protein